MCTEADFTSMSTEADFTYDEATFEVTDKILKAFKEEGYIMLRYF